jgi:hypothetical protein
MFTITLLLTTSSGVSYASSETSRTEYNKIQNGRTKSDAVHKMAVGLRTPAVHAPSSAPSAMLRECFTARRTSVTATVLATAPRSKRVSVLRLKLMLDVNFDLRKKIQKRETEKEEQTAA